MLLGLVHGFVFWRENVWDAAGLFSELDEGESVEVNRGKHDEGWKEDEMMLNGRESEKRVVGQCVSLPVVSQLTGDCMCS